MRRLAILAALAAFSCATTPVQQCVNISGVYEGKGACLRRGTGSSRLVLDERLALVDLGALTVEQIGCALRLHVRGEDGAERIINLDHDLEWKENGVTFSWKPPKTGAPSFTQGTTETRSLMLELDPDDGRTLKVTSALDIRGIALLFVPYHDRGEAQCVLTRTK